MKRRKRFFFSKTIFFLYTFPKYSKSKKMIFSRKKLKPRWKIHFKEKLSLETHSTAGLLLLTFKDFENIQVFQENIYTFWKNSNLCFEKPYYFSRILRQICYELVIIKNKFRIWALPGLLAGKFERKRTAQFLSGWFSFHISSREVSRGDAGRGGWRTLCFEINYSNPSGDEKGRPP